MNRTMNKVAVLAVAGVLASGAMGFAAEAAMQDQPAHMAKHAAVRKEMTLKGVVSTNGVTVAGKKYITFVLVTAAGDKLHLPAPKAGKDATSAPAINLADYLGQNVKVVAFGSEKKKGDKTVVRVKTLKTIEKIPYEAAPAKMA